MASTDDLVPVRKSRCPAWCSCSACYPNFVTRWFSKRLEKPLSTLAVYGIAVFVVVCVAVFMSLSFNDAMHMVESELECENKSESLQIVFVVFVYLGIPCIAAIAYVIRREPFVRDDTDEGHGGEGLEMVLLVVPVVLLAVGCVALDLVFFLLVTSCVHRDRGVFPGLSRYHPGTGLAFHVGRLALVVAQAAMFSRCFAKRSFARQKVYTVLLFTLVVLADLASWFYEIVDRPSALCKANNNSTSSSNNNINNNSNVYMACWDATVSKSNTCPDQINLLTEEFCTFVQFQLYCQPLVGTFALLSLATMYSMWSKAREGEGGDAAVEPSVPRRFAAGGFMQFFSVTVVVLSVGLWAITQQAITTSSQADYYKVVQYYSFKVAYFGLFIISTLAGCVSVRASGPHEFRARGADVLLLLLSAVGILWLNVRGLSGWAEAPGDLAGNGCPHGVTEADFAKLRGLLMADAVLNLVQLVLQTTFVFSSVTHRRLEGRVESYCGLLCLFNLCVWINGSFIEVQSTPQTTCFTSPVQRAAFGYGDWNVFVHVLQPVCMFYWLWSLLLMGRLVLRRVGPPRRGTAGATVVQVGEAGSITIPMNSHN